MKLLSVTRLIGLITLLSTTALADTFYPLVPEGYDIVTSFEVKAGGIGNKMYEQELIPSNIIGSRIDWCNAQKDELKFVPISELQAARQEALDLNEEARTDRENESKAAYQTVDRLVLINWGPMSQREYTSTSTATPGSIVTELYRQFGGFGAFFFHYCYHSVVHSIDQTGYVIVVEPSDGPARHR